MRNVKQQYLVSIALVIVSFLQCAGAQLVLADDEPAPLTEAKLKLLSGQLENSKTRMQALSALIKDCSGALYRTSSNMMLYPDDKTRKLYERAVSTVNRCATIPTLKLALQGNDEDLHYWALRQIGPRQRELIPYVQALATPGRSVWGNQALETLRYCKVSEPEIAKQVAVSKDPTVLLHQIHDDKTFNSRLSQLLEDPSEKVQKNALDFVAINEGMAEMYHRAFDAKIFEQVMQFSKSPAIPFRESAVAALCATRKFGPERAMSRLEEMSRDSSPDVRWRVAMAMKKFDGKRAEAIIAVLLKDPSPTVRYFAAVSGGPDKHIDVLRELTKCADPEIRGYATGQIKELKVKDVR